MFGMTTATGFLLVIQQTILGMNVNTIGLLVKSYLLASRSIVGIGWN